MTIHGLEAISDWESRLARQDAFWDREVLDRPVVVIPVPKREGRKPFPASHHASLRDRWLDAEYQAATALAWVENTEYYGDALPIACPNLGPEIFSTFFGAELIFSETTSWSEPILHDWNRADRLQFSREGFWWRKLEEITEAYLEAGRGRFFTGVTDIHPGGDAIASFRDPMNLNLDLLDAAREVKDLLERVNRGYFEMYDHYADKLQSAGQAITAWPIITSSRRWYVPSNDFSCMISREMFDEFFLPGIAEECRHMEASIYHLDGPDAVRHLDSLLSIPELNAIQWIQGAGHGRAVDWLDLYRRIQDAGKGIQIIDATPDQIPAIMDRLRPEGVWMQVYGVKDREEAEAVVKQVSRWGC